MPAKWVIHLKDGKTLTDADCFPHEVEVLEKFGYSPDDITSVERIINGKHLSLRKSKHIESFFVATENSVDMRMSPGPQPKHTTTKRILGCYLKDTDPAIQVRLIMDPRTYNTWVKFLDVKTVTRKGINAKLLNPRQMKNVQLAYQKDIIDSRYAIMHHKNMGESFSTPNGFGVHFKKPKLRVEMVIRNQNVLLGFTDKGQKLKI